MLHLKGLWTRTFQRGLASRLNVRAMNEISVARRHESEHWSDEVAEARQGRQDVAGKYCAKVGAGPLFDETRTKLEQTGRGRTEAKNHKRKLIVLGVDLIKQIVEDLIFVACLRNLVKKNCDEK